MDWSGRLWNCHYSPNKDRETKDCQKSHRHSCVPREARNEAVDSLVAEEPMTPKLQVQVG